MLTISAMESTEHPEASEAIDRLGGNVAVAAMFGISSQAISKWRKEGIPPARLMYLKVVRPDAFQPASDGTLNAAKEAA